MKEAKDIRTIKREHYIRPLKGQRFRSSKGVFEVTDIEYNYEHEPERLEITGEDGISNWTPCETFKQTEHRLTFLNN